MKNNFKTILISHGYKSPSSDKRKYTRIYRALKNAILNRSLVNKSKLPPTRILAKDLKVSRSTIIKAYELLVLENYIRGKTGSGYQVIYSPNREQISYVKSTNSLKSYPKLSKTGIHFKKTIINYTHESDKEVAFRPGLPPLDIFPVLKWKSLLNNYWKNVRASQLSYSDTKGLLVLRQNIANYLKIYRNIICDPEQIIVTTGSLHSLFLIGQSLIDQNDVVLMENPTYPQAYQLFKSLQASVKQIPVDKKGITIPRLKYPKAKLIYTTPSNQYPTGIKMSLKRRKKLVKWASKKPMLIIEDDYDHEFSNWENPLPSIYSLDTDDRVIYLGTFNKLLHPSLRIGYMVAPSYLLDTIEAIYGQSSRFVSPSLQNTLSEFIEKDYLNEHLRNIINITSKRKKVFYNNFSQLFGEDITLNTSHSGLHLIGSINSSVEDSLLCDIFKKVNVTVHPLSNYYMGKKKANGLVMGYSSVNAKRIKDNLRKMKSAYSNL